MEDVRQPQAIVRKTFFAMARATAASPGIWTSIPSAIGTATARARLYR